MSVDKEVADMAPVDMAVAEGGIDMVAVGKVVVEVVADIAAAVEVTADIAAVGRVTVHSSWIAGEEGLAVVVEGKVGELAVGQTGKDSAQALSMESLGMKQRVLSDHDSFVGEQHCYWCRMEHQGTEVPKQPKE